MTLTHEARAGIGRATQEDSKWMDRVNGCFPTTMAFTHGLPLFDYNEWLNVAPDYHSFVDFSGQISKRYGQELRHKSIIETDIDKFSSLILNSLVGAKSAWISLYQFNEENHFVGHIIGVIRLGENEFLRWDIADGENKIKPMTAEQLAKYVDEQRTTNVKNVDVFAFK